MKIKTIHREDWVRILEKDEIIRDFGWKGRSGKIALMLIRKVSSPYIVGSSAEKVTIADAGYSWVQIALDGAFFWITSMFDENDRLAEIYIDMTGGNFMTEEGPCFADLYLDYVVHVRNGRVEELDREELAAAYRKGMITREAYERTLREGEKIHNFLLEDRQELITLLVREQRRLKNALTVDKSD